MLSDYKAPQNRLKYRMATFKVKEKKIIAILERLNTYVYIQKELSVKRTAKLHIKKYY